MYEPGRIVAAPGSQALIELLPRLRSKSRVAILGPTYNEHAACWHREGHVCAAVETLSEALSTTPDVIVVVNPNNPDGRVVSAADLEQAAAFLSTRDGWLVVDEAFADLEDGVSLAHRNLPATIILRSFGKTYGLAGIRLGFALAPNDFTNTIRDHRIAGGFRTSARDRRESACRSRVDRNATAALARCGPRPRFASGICVGSGLSGYSPVPAGAAFGRLPPFRETCEGRYLGPQVSPLIPRSCASVFRPGALSKGSGQRLPKKLPHKEARIDRGRPLKLAEHLETQSLIEQARLERIGIEPHMVAAAPPCSASAQRISRVPIPRPASSGTTSMST